MYMLLNDDQSINYMDDHPVKEEVCFDGVELIELRDKTVAALLGDIPFEEAQWDREQKKVVRNPRLMLSAEAWRRQKASERIQHFYPLYKQVNLLRSGDKSAIKKMALFIDKCRKWSNDLSIHSEVIDRLEP